MQRTLEVQSAAKLASDATNLRTINYFGARGEHLEEVAMALAVGIDDLTSDIKANLEVILPPEMLEQMVKIILDALERPVEKAAGRKGHDLSSNLAHIKKDLQT